MDVEADDGDDAGEAGEGEEVFAPVFHCRLWWGRL